MAQTSEEAYDNWKKLQGPEKNRGLSDGPSGAQGSSGISRTAKTAKNWNLAVIGYKSLRHATRGKKARRRERAHQQKVSDAKKHYEKVLAAEQKEAQRKANRRYEREMRLKESYAKPADTTHPMAYNMNTIAEM